MAYTTVTLADVAKEPGGTAVPYAVVVAYPRVGFANAGTTTLAYSAIAGASGAFSLAINATDDAGTAVLNPNGLGTPSYHVMVFDPGSGERVYDGDVQLPHGTGPYTLATLPNM